MKSSCLLCLELDLAALLPDLAVMQDHPDRYFHHLGEHGRSTCDGDEFDLTRATEDRGCVGGPEDRDRD